jgi:hypothetical protein
MRIYHVAQAVKGWPDDTAENRTEGARNDWPPTDSTHTASKTIHRRIDMNCPRSIVIVPALIVLNPEVRKTPIHACECWV